MNITKVAELEKTESFECEYKGQTVHFEALSNTLTPHFLQQIDSQAKYARATSETVKTWDVTKDDEGTPWPLTEPELARLPVDFLDTILATIAKSWTGDKKKPEVSQNGLAQTAS